MVSAFMKQSRQAIKNQRAVLDQSVIDSAVWGGRARQAMWVVEEYDWYRKRQSPVC